MKSECIQSQTHLGEEFEEADHGFQRRLHLREDFISEKMGTLENVFD